MILKPAIFATVGMFIAATPALSAEFKETQPATHKVQLFVYEGDVENLCPAGRQPVRYSGGISCCGSDEVMTGYSEHVVVHKTPRRVVRASAPVAAPVAEQIPLGKSPNSFDGT